MYEGINKRKVCEDVVILVLAKHDIFVYLNSRMKLEKSVNRFFRIRRD